jgi:hypothetical protein
MSTDFSIYAPRPDAVTHAELHAAAQSQGWHLLVMHKRVIVEPSDKPLKLQATYDVYGAKTPALLAKARAALTTKDGYKLLDALYDKGLNSLYFGVYVVDPDEVTVDDKFQEEAAQAKFLYGFNGHGGPLQVALWKALGGITGGLLENPQSGEISRARSIPAPKANAGKPRANRGKSK